jgi:hypothetical protein
MLLVVVAVLATIATGCGDAEQPGTGKTGKSAPGEGTPPATAAKPDNSHEAVMVEPD